MELLTELVGSETASQVVGEGAALGAKMAIASLPNSSKEQLMGVVDDAEAFLVRLKDDVLPVVRRHIEESH